MPSKFWGSPASANKLGSNPQSAIRSDRWTPHSQQQPPSNHSIPSSSFTAGQQTVSAQRSLLFAAALWRISRSVSHSRKSFGFFFPQPLQKSEHSCQSPTEHVKILLVFGISLSFSALPVCDTSHSHTLHNHCISTTTHYHPTLSSKPPPALSQSSWWHLNGIKTTTENRPLSLPWYLPQISLMENSLEMNSWIFITRSTNRVT